MSTLRDRALIKGVKASAGADVRLQKLRGVVPEFYSSGLTVMMRNSLV
jgi:hypothetical protein